MSYNYIKAIRPLLEGLGYGGLNRNIFEAVPHMLQDLSLEGVRELMANLGYLSQKKKVSLKNIPDHPGLFHIDEKVFVMEKKEGDHIYFWDIENNENLVIPSAKNSKGIFCYFYTQDKTLKTSKGWVHDLWARFQHLLWQLIGIGLLNAICGLILPLFVRGVFDWAIASKSNETLLYLVGGLMIALGAHHLVHLVQNKTLAYVGARVYMIVGTSVISRILKMPYQYIEGAAVPDQVSRIKQFDSIRDFFTSPLAQLFLEAPFFIFFLIALGILGGPLALIPLVLVIFFIVLGVVLFPLVRAATKMSSFAHNDKLAFLIEVFGKINTLKFLGGEKSFERRFEEKAYNHSKAAEHNEAIMAYASNLSQILIKIAGVVTILWGAIRVMNGDMTIGSLVAVVLLIWRALSPFQTAFMFFSQFDMTMSTMKQINQLMAMPLENYAPSYITPREVKGHVFCDNVTFRYGNSPNLALQGVTMDARPGEIITIMGENGSGKSTLLKLLLGFYQPIGGTISFDGLDIKQVPVNHLRSWIGFVPQQIQFFHGTIEQNLLLAAPDVTEDDVIWACKEAFVWDDICKMPDGLKTRLTDRTVSALNSGFQQKLSLARAYLRNAPVLMFDEPGSNLDMQGDEWFKQTLLKWRGKKTTIIVTHRPSVVKLSDRTLVLSAGKMRFFGPTDKVLELMAKESTAA